MGNVFSKAAAYASAVPHRLGWRGLYPDGKEAPDEGHGFSRAEKDCPMRALAPEVRFALHVLKSVPQRLKPRDQGICGTAEAEAVPFVYVFRRLRRCLRPRI